MKSAGTMMHWYIQTCIGYVVRFDPELEVVIWHPQLQHAKQFRNARAACSFIRHYAVRGNGNGLDWERVEVVGLRDKSESTP
jgi:hypothetical protein